MVKRTEGHEIIAPQWSAQAIRDAIALEQQVDALASKFREILVLSKAVATGAGNNSAAGIQNITTSYDSATISAREYGKVVAERSRLEAKLQTLLSGAADENIRLAKSIEQVTQAKKTDAAVSDQIVGVYRDSVNQLNQVKKAMLDLHAAGKANTAEFDKLGKSFQTLNNRVQGAEQAVGNYSRQVGNYAGGQKKYNYEMFQMTQIMRELPNFAISARIGIMALSNNLPQLGTAFKDIATDINETTGKMNGYGFAMKTMLKSIVSWQSALLIGITLAIQFSDEIGDWISGLGSVNRELEEQKKLREEMAEIDKKHLHNFAQERAEIEVLVAAIKSDTLSKKEKAEAIERLNKISPEYLGFITAENFATKAASDAIDAYIVNINKLARAKAVMEKFSEYEKKILDVDMVGVHSGLRTEVRSVIGNKEADWIEGHLAEVGLDPKIHGEVYNREYIRLVNEARVRVRAGYKNEQTRLLQGAASDGILGSVGQVNAGKDAKDKKPKYNDYGKELAEATVGAMQDGYIKESAELAAEFAEKKKKAMFDHGVGANDPLIVGLGQQEEQEQAALLDKWLDKARKENEQILKEKADARKKEFESRESYMDSAERISESEIKTNYANLMAATTNAEERKKLEQELAKALIENNIYYLEAKIKMYELDMDLSNEQIQKLEEMKARLDQIKAEYGVDPKDPKGKKVDPKKDLKDNVKASMDLLRAFDQLMLNEEKRQQRQLDQQIAQTQRKADMLRELAALGSKDAKDSIALEEKRQAELERKQQQLEKRAQRRQLAIAALNSYNSKVTRGDQNATANTISDLALLLSFVNTAAFHDGTEEVGKDRQILNRGTSRDPILAWVEPKEKIFSERHSAMIGDMTNEQVAMMAVTHRMGIYHDDAPANTMQEGFKEIVQAIKDQPVPSLSWDPIEKMLVETTRTQTHIHNKRIKPNSSLLR